MRRARNNLAQLTTDIMAEAVRFALDKYSTLPA
jgi:hypothetical protein